MLRVVMSELGKAGGRARAEKLSAKRRKEIAQAASARAAEVRSAKAAGLPVPAKKKVAKKAK